METKNVIIIGAGAAGLLAARTLLEEKINFLLLESTERIGGRAQTKSGNPHIEYGPEYLHGNTPVSDALLEQYHLPYYDLEFDYHLYKNGKLRRLPDFWKRLGKVLGHMQVLKQDVSFNQYISGYDHHSKSDQELAKLFVEGFGASDLDLVSSKELKNLEDQVCNPKVRKLRRPLHGYGELMEKMAKETLSHILFSHVVQEIEWKKGNVVIRGINNREQIPFEFHAKKILNTVSVAALKKQHFSPMPHALKHFLSQLEMGQVVKMIGEIHPDFFHQFENHSFPFISSPELSFGAW